MEIIPGQIKGTHVVLTGPMSGSVTLADGSTVDVGPREIEVDSPEKAAEVAHLIGLRYADEGHPDDVELDSDEESETFGQMVQRPFVYVSPEELAELEISDEPTDLNAQEG